MEKLEDKVRSMTARQIIMAMVEGLRDPVTRISMTTYGKSIGERCYGCAATNAICKIQGIQDTDPLKFGNNQDRGTREIIFNSDHAFLYFFENAINDLRRGDIIQYNFTAEHLGIARIFRSEIVDYLPTLSDSYTEKHLEQYVKLADSQPE